MARRLKARPRGEDYCTNCLHRGARVPTAPGSQYCAACRDAMKEREEVMMTPAKRAQRDEEAWRAESAREDAKGTLAGLIGALIFGIPLGIAGLIFLGGLGMVIGFIVGASVGSGLGFLTTLKR